MNKKYLDKVVDQLVSETRIESNGIYTSFLPVSFRISLHCFITSYHSFSRPILFSKHCKNIYGLTEEEIGYVWEQYYKIITDKIKNKPLNESTGNKFLDKVVGQLVNETRIGSNGAYTSFPFLPSSSTFSVPFSSISSSPSSFSFFLLPSPVTPHNSSSLLPLPFYSFSRHPYSLPFYKHCRDVYGLNEEEVDYVWDEYRRIIIKKMTDIS